MQCDIEIETLAAPGGNDVRRCELPASWTLSAYYLGVKHEVMMCCVDHIGEQLAILIEPVPGDPIPRQIICTRILP